MGLLRPALLASAFLLVLAGCSRQDDSSFQGYIEGKFVYVASPQAGRLEHLAVERGETVAVGASLFALEQEPEFSAEAQAREGMVSEESRLADLKTGKRPLEKEPIAAQLAQAKVDHQKAVDILKSDEEQYQAGGMPLTDLIAARAAVQSSAALVQQYQSNLNVADLPGREAQIEAQEKTVSAAKASLQQATWKLQQKQAKSTRAGLVFDTLYREGEWVPAGNPVVQLLPPENVEVRFFVPEAVAGKLQVGQAITIRCDGRNAGIAAKVSFVSTQVEYTPPVIYSNENRAKLMFMVVGKTTADDAVTLHPGQPVGITIP